MYRRIVREKIEYGLSHNILRALRPDVRIWARLSSRYTPRASFT